MTTIQIRRGTSTQWTTKNPVLSDGEIGWDSTLDRFKMGDGTSTWSMLPFYLTDALDQKADVDHSHSALDSATDANVVDTIVKRSTGGWINAFNVNVSGQPTSSGHLTRKSYVDSAVGQKISTSAIGAANGVASLDGNGRIPIGQVPPFQSTITNYQPEMITNPFRMYGKTGTRLNLPSHVAGNTTGQATHPSVVFRPEGWGSGSYPYWMAVTPYQGAADSMEDPNILCSRDGINWVKPVGAPSPLDDAPGSPSNYNSDTEIAFGPDDALYVFWRNLDPAAVGTEEKIYYRRSLDGITWESKVLVYQSNQNTLRLLSPTIMWENGAWTMWAVDIATTPDRIVRLRSNTDQPKWADGWSAPVAVTYTNGTASQAYQTNKGPWHIAVTRAYGRYHMLVNDNRLNSPPPEGDLVYMTSTDGIVWSSGVNPCLPRLQPGQHDMMYRATLIPSVNRGVQGFRVWYGALQYYANPQVWSVFHTFIADAPHTQRGEVTLTLPAANGSVPSGAQAALVFDPPFKDYPDLVFTTNSTLLSIGYDQLTPSGVVIFAENFSAYAANNVKVRWTATEPY